MSKTVSKSDCIDALQEYENLTGEKPSVRRYRDYYNNHNVNWPHDETIKYKFGLWNDAMSAAGFQTNKSSILAEQKYGVPDIIDMPEEEFNNLNKGERYRKRQQAKWANRKIDIGCERCGYDENPSALEWHHINGRSDGDYSVGTLINNSYSDEKIEEELEKCELLCANCHRIETSGDIYDVD